MARIEELPDDFDESLNLNKPSPPTPETPFGIKPQPHSNNADPTASTAPALPPAMASIKSHTADEILSMMNQTPLFMTDIERAQRDAAKKAGGPTGDGDDDVNTFLDAIRALQHEGTRAQVAENFRETGNELARERKWADAREFYTKALVTLGDERGESEGKWEKSKDVEGDKARMRETQEKVLVNRALCNLEMSTYPSSSSSSSSYTTIPAHSR